VNVTGINACALNVMGPVCFDSSGVYFVQPLARAAKAAMTMTMTRPVRLFFFSMRNAVWELGMRDV
jgi:hypothetical protein